MPRQSIDEVVQGVERWGHLGLAAAELGVQRASLEGRLRKAGLWHPNRRGFTPREDAAIRAEYQPGAVLAVALELDRSWLAVVERAFRIGAIEPTPTWLLDDGIHVQTNGIGEVGLSWVVMGQQESLPIVIDVPGDPVAWSRAGRQDAHGGPSYTPKRVQSAIDRLATRFATILTFRRNVALGCAFHLETMRRVDVDNLVKLVLDAGNDGALWEDDSQVTTLVTKVTLDREHPRTVISVLGYDDPAMPRGSEYLPRCQTCHEPFKAPPRKRSPVTWCSPECKAEQTLSLL
jgi:Holliday junction resolvase RusA-like endonuclease